MGYVVFVADMYGDGKNTADPEVADKWAGQVRGTPLMRERARAALEQFRAVKQVDPDRIGVIGFCFGGTGALEFAYSGADVKGAVSFHGSLTVPEPGDTIKASILVCHGAADTFESPESIAAFQKTMEERGVDWQMIYYGHAVHSFTNPTSGKYGIPGVGHNEKAERRSFALMDSFLKDVF
jgi:dienelactone hydrolase